MMYRTRKFNRLEIVRLRIVVREKKKNEKRCSAKPQIAQIAMSN